MSDDTAQLPSTSNTSTTNAKVTLLKQVPYTTRLRHHFELYNPILWWRVTFMKKRSVSWNTYDMLLFCIIPNFNTLSRWMLPYASPKLKEMMSKTERDWIWWTRMTLQVPLCLYLCDKLSRTVRGILQSIHEIQQSRMMAHPDAYQCLYERIQQRRAYRTYAYDVYVPPATAWNVLSDPTNETQFILFLPGAYVEHVAYSQPAALLSDHGYIVIVMSSEPLGIVDMHLPQFYVSNIQRIQHEMETKYANHPTVSNSCINSNKNQCRWVFMGHSMGSLSCTKLIPYFPKVKEIVLWGSAPFLDYMGNLSDITADDNDGLRVLVVQGTKDQVIQCFCTPEMILEYWKRLPASTTKLHEIIGGTHQGFGNYIRNIKDDNEHDSMPIQEQHSIAVQVTIDFMKRTDY